MNKRYLKYRIKYCYHRLNGWVTIKPARLNTVHLAVIKLITFGILNDSNLSITGISPPVTRTKHNEGRGCYNAMHETALILV